jgi:hypothetical protein
MKDELGKGLDRSNHDTFAYMRRGYEVPRMVSLQAYLDTAY